MPKGGARLGSGRPRLQQDGHSVKAFFILTDDADAMLDELREAEGGVSRSEMVRRLIVKAGELLRKKAKSEG